MANENNIKQYLVKNEGNFHIEFLNDKDQKETLKIGGETFVFKKAYDRLMSSPFVIDITKETVDKSKKLKDLE
jgi:cellobiose-specific phosphotransferase system component IIA